MTVRDKRLQFTDRLRAQIGLRSRCVWVQEHLGEYCTWYMDLAELRAAIENRLHTCSDCAQGWSGDQSASDPIEGGLAPCTADERLFIGTALVADVLAKIDQYEAGQAS